MYRPTVAAILVGALALAGCATTATATPIGLNMVHDVSDSGVAVGLVGVPDGDNGWRWEAWLADTATGRRQQIDVATDGPNRFLGRSVAINGAGTVVVGVAEFQPFRWRVGTDEVQPLIPLTAGTQGQAADVNDAGLAVGHTGRDYNETATAWDPDTDQPRRLRTLGGSRSRVYQVNDHGIGVGLASLPGDSLEGHAVSWDLAAGTVRRLQEPAGATSSEALAVNDTGDIVGIVGFQDGPWSTQLARWDAATGAVRLIGPRGTFGDGVVRPAAVNDRGIVVGDKGHATFNPSGIGLDTNAVRFDLSTGVRKDLAPTNSHAAGITDDGNIFGWQLGEIGSGAGVRWTLR